MGARFASPAGEALRPPPHPLPLFQRLTPCMDRRKKHLEARAGAKTPKARTGAKNTLEVQKTHCRKKNALELGPAQKTP